MWRGSQGSNLADTRLKTSPGFPAPLPIRWRPRPESNRSRGICNPACSPWLVAEVVGAAGFEPANLPVQSRTFYQLNYTPEVVDALGIDPSPTGISDRSAHLRTTSVAGLEGLEPSTTWLTAKYSAAELQTQDNTP